MSPSKFAEIPQEVVHKVLQSLDEGDPHHPVRFVLDSGYGWWVLCRCETRTQHAQRPHEAWALWEDHRDAARILRAL